jgi:hypothetical protein
VPNTALQWTGTHAPLDAPSLGRSSGTIPGTGAIRLVIKGSRLAALDATVSSSAAGGWQGRGPRIFQTPFRKLSHTHNSKQLFSFL